MKFENNTKWNTKQLRRIIAAVVNRYLTKGQRHRLEVIANPVRARTRVKIRLDPYAPSCPITIAVPNDSTANDIRQVIAPWMKADGAKAAPRHAESYDQYRTWSEKVAEMPLEVAPVTQKKKTAIEKAVESLKLAEKNSTAQKSKLLRAANKVQEYDKKAKYYKARIVLLKKQRSGEVRKKKSPKAGDRDFRIARPKRGT